MQEKNKHVICRLRVGAYGENWDLGRENAALGLRRRAAFSSPRSQVFTIRTSQPANNIYIFHEVLTRNQRKQNFWQGLQSPNAACASKSLAKRLFYGIKVSGYYNFDKELLQADQRQLNRFKKTHFKKSIKTAAEVIEVLHENSLYKITPEFSKVASILAVIPATSCSAERSFSGLRRLKTYIRNTMGQRRLNSLAIICIERAYGNQVIVNNMDKMIDIFGQRHGRKNFFF